ncbi:hypothetical protein D3P08_09630 [Paenibacillus nanensis]|uniref:Uncharacterized protein n=1 Tax=Paenibacillus nanensis TaxID=393251 RepID=A0A3A1V4Y4_9BACL|nr:hypothetical protein [Paenibacillus nanensis]RIX53673.1 hypothetical protein D3P08_09630 [Paenibacillus nanensis]
MNLYLYHYYEYEHGPFRNLSFLDIEAAKLMMQSLREDGGVFASRRSEDYLDVRRELERKAREIFVQKGGSPKTEYPHYMTLGPCEWIKTWYKQGMEINIHWDELEENTISFTYGDLFPTMRVKDGKSYRGQVYTKSEIMSVIREYGFPQEWNPNGDKGPERYIEVQIWDDTFMKGFG